MVAIDKGNIKTMPARSMPATPDRTPGALLMGDAVNIRHPISGGGMVVALSDVVVLRNLLRPLRNLNDVPALVKDLESIYTLRKVSSLCLSLLAFGSNLEVTSYKIILGFAAASGFYHKHIGRCRVQGVMCIP